MQRGSDNSGGLGPQLVGEKIAVNRRVVSVVRQLGEGNNKFTIAFRYDVPMSFCLDTTMMELIHNAFFYSFSLYT